MERSTRVTWNTHLRAPKRNVCWFCHCYLILFLHSNLYFKTFLPLFSFRQWRAVSLRNSSEWAIAGLWTPMFSTIPARKRFLDVCPHRPFLVGAAHHEFFKGFFFKQSTNVKLHSSVQMIGVFLILNLTSKDLFSEQAQTCRHHSKHVTAPIVPIECAKLVVYQSRCSCFSAPWF